MRTIKILCRLCGYAGLFESSVGAHARRYVSLIATQVMPEDTQNDKKTLFIGTAVDVLMRTAPSVLTPG